MKCSKIVLAAVVLCLACQIRLAISQENPFVRFTVSGMFSNADKAQLSGWFIVNEENGAVVRADLYHGSHELSTLSVAPGPDYVTLGLVNSRGDIMHLFLMAPGNDGSLAGYTGGKICSNVDIHCGMYESSFFGGFVSYDTEDVLYEGSVSNGARLPMVGIAVKPHGEGPALINPRSHSLSPIAILSDRQFDATTDADTQSLTFGPTGTEQSIVSCDKDGRDINNDGLPDLICHFNPRLTQFLPWESLGIVIGKTMKGSPFVGTERVLVKPIAK